MPDDDPALSLATTDQLCAEFKRRFPAVVILLESDADQDPLVVRTAGPSSRNLGMMLRSGVAMLGLLEKADEDELNH